MLLKGIRYCDCCGIKLNINNNKCGYELCDRCNERLEDEVGQNMSKRIKLIINIPHDDYIILKTTGAWNSSLIECIKNGRPVKHSSATGFLNFLYQVIPPNEMERYIEMYNCKNDKNNC